MNKFMHMHLNVIKHRTIFFPLFLLFLLASIVCIPELLHARDSVNVEGGGDGEAKLVCKKLCAGIFKKLKKKKPKKKKPKNVEQVVEQVIDTTPKPFLKMVCMKTGMFWPFLSVIGALKMYKDDHYSGVEVDFGFDGDGGLYFDPTRGLNWWEYYFEPLNVGNRENKEVIVSFNGPPGHDFAMLTEFHVPRMEAAELIKKHIRIKPHIQEKVQRFVDQNFTNSTIIGVHYRGTDKYVEAPRAKYESVVEHIRAGILKLKKIKKNRKNKAFNIKIFVATDEQAFLDYLHTIFPGKIIAYDAFRSSNNEPVHEMDLGNNYKKGEDAVMDCLLLSRCEVLLKTSSNLSLCSSYFNPDIPVVHITCRPWRDPLQ